MRGRPSPAHPICSIQRPKLVSRRAKPNSHQKKAWGRGQCPSMRRPSRHLPADSPRLLPRPRVRSSLKKPCTRCRRCPLGRGALTDPPPLTWPRHLSRGVLCLPRRSHAHCPPRHSNARLAPFQSHRSLSSRLLSPHPLPPQASTSAGASPTRWYSQTPSWVPGRKSERGCRSPSGRKGAGGGR